MQIDSAVHKHLAKFALPPLLSFGETKMPAMYTAVFRDGRWQSGHLGPYRALEIDPASRVLHYGVEAFEGLKAYRRSQKRPHLFRPERNWERLNRSLARLTAPALPREVFFEGVGALAGIVAPFIPGAPGESLYLRPLVIDTDSSLGIASPSKRYLFVVLASPAGAYQAAPMRVLIERRLARAMPGGTGAVKIGGNYAAALLSNARAAERNLSTSLWLDAGTHSFVEELSGMNIFFVIDGALHTPALTDTILPGVTRESIVQLAGDMGLEVFERQIALDDVLQDIRQGSASEAFACGTAVTVLGIERFVEDDGAAYDLAGGPGPVASRLKTALLDIQEGRAPDPYGWTYEVPALST